MADGYNAMGSLLGETGRLKEAEAAYAEALALCKQLAAEFPKVPDYRTTSPAGCSSWRKRLACAGTSPPPANCWTRRSLTTRPRSGPIRAIPTTGRIIGWSLVELTQSCAGQGDRPAALAAATKRRDLGWDPAADAYQAAWTLAWCVPIVEKDDKLDAPKRQAEMQFYADQAMAMLRDAVAKGYKDVEHMKKDKDLDPLREREDFKKLVAELEAAKEAPSKKP